MIVLRFRDWQDAAGLVAVLLAAADQLESSGTGVDRATAKRYRRLADALGDELDRLPVPTG